MANLYDCQVWKIEATSATTIDTDACPVCEVTRARPKFGIEGTTARLSVCEGCGLGRLYPLPTPEEISGCYPPEYYGDTGEKFEPMIEKLVRQVAARHASFLCRGLKRGDRVLDVGCGRGVLLRAFADQGYEVHGFETSAPAARGADPRAQIKIANRLENAQYADGYFDRVILWHVLEHIPDPRQSLQEIHRILKPGGQLIVAVPNFSSIQSRWAQAAWFHLDLPRHLFHFPVSALETLLDRCGFTCRTQHHFSLRQNPFGWVQSALNRSGKLPRNGLYVLLQQHSHANGAMTDRRTNSGGEAGSQVFDDGGTQDFDRRTRLMFRLAYFLGMPIGLLLAILATGLRSGATVHIVAEAR